MEIKCHQKHSLVVYDGYVKYEEEEMHGLVTILRNN